MLHGEVRSVDPWNMAKRDSLHGLRSARQVFAKENRLHGQQSGQSGAVEGKLPELQTLDMLHGMVTLWV